MQRFIDFLSEDVGGYRVPTVAGYALVGALALALLLVAAFISGKKTGKQKASQVAFSAVAIALATVLSCVKLIPMPMGGSITAFSMLFICLIGYWYGLRAGLTCAISYGAIQLMIGPYVIHPLQLVFDYILAFGALGLSGLASKNRKWGLLIGYWIGVVGRFVFSFVSGMVFFADAADEYNMVLPLYSAAYNGLYLFGEGALTTVLLVIPPVRKAFAKLKSDNAAD